MLNFLKSIFSARNQYELLSINEEKKQTSVRLGVQSILLSVIGLIVIVVTVILGTMCLKNIFETKVDDGTYSYPLLSLLGVIFLYGIALVSFGNILFSGMSFSLHQMRLNKRKVGKASLIICIICIVASIIVAVLFIGSAWNVK